MIWISIHSIEGCIATILERVTIVVRSVIGVVGHEIVSVAVVRSCQQLLLHLLKLL